MKNLNKLIEITKRLRYLILTATTKAGSGHPTSCLSAVELMTVLKFGGFFQKNDHLIFSKGHAAPLLYALMVESGLLTQKEMLTLRQFGSRLEGHPVPNLPGIEIATGSLGQGLSIGVGMALADFKLIQNKQHTYVLLGDGETMEGSIWEAASLAGYHKLINLTALVDLNRLEQDGATISGWDSSYLVNKFKACDWQVEFVKDGHNLSQIDQALKASNHQQPKVILAKTIKGKGVSFLEDQADWHGRILSETELNQALTEIGLINQDQVSELLVKLDQLSQHV